MADRDIALSVMIPNFNYSQYIGETIRSVLAQATADIEIAVSDNASTDTSVEVVRSFRDDRIKLTINPCNVGFAANLDRVARIASGRRMILLSSDDRARPGAIAAFRKLEIALGARADRAVWGAASGIIDAKGNPTGTIAADPKMWRDSVIDPELSRAVGAQVRAIPASQLLRRSLDLLRLPLPFNTTCYSKALHDEVGGYSGGQLVNPDKWFLWKLLAIADMAYFIDEELFDYRVHGAGQGAQQQKSGALKHLTDEYVATFNLPDSVLAKAGLARESLAAAFIEQDIALRGLVSLAAGNREHARRAVHFGLAAYPKLVRKNPKVWALRALLALGPVGSKVATAVKGRAQARWAAREGDRR